LAQQIEYSCSSGDSSPFFFGCAAVPAGAFTVCVAAAASAIFAKLFSSPRQGRVGAGARRAADRCDRPFQAIPLSALPEPVLIRILHTRVNLVDHYRKLRRRFSRRSRFLKHVFVVPEREFLTSGLSPFSNTLIFFGRDVTPSLKFVYEAGISMIFVTVAG